MKKIRVSEWFLLVTVIVFFVTAIFSYQYLPAQIASHWNAVGNANGYLSRFWGDALFPLIFLVLAVLFFAIPRVDPRRDNIAKFRKYYDYFVIAFSFCFYYIYLLTLAWNMGYVFNLSSAIIPPLAGLFYIIGMIFPHVEPNWTIGIRTPWTISSESVWHKTHQAGSWAFRISAVIGTLGTFLPAQIGIWLLIAPIIISAIGLVIYSYVLYEKER